MVMLLIPRLQCYECRYYSGYTRQILFGIPVGYVHCVHTGNNLFRYLRSQRLPLLFGNRDLARRRRFCLRREQPRVCKMRFYFHDVVLDAIPASVGLLGCCWSYSRRKKQAKSHAKRAIAPKGENQEEVTKRNSSPEPAAGVAQRLPLSSEERRQEKETSTSLLSAESVVPGSLREKRRDELEIREKELEVKEAHLAQENEELQRMWQDLKKHQEELQLQKVSFQQELESLHTSQEAVEMEKAQLKRDMDQLKKDQEQLQLQKVSLQVDLESLRTSQEAVEMEKAQLKPDMDQLKKDQEQLQLQKVSFQRDLESLHTSQETVEVEKAQLKLDMDQLKKDQEQLQLQKISFQRDLESLRTSQEAVEMEKALLKLDMDQLKKDQEQLQLQKVSFHRNLESLHTAQEDLKRDKEQFRLDMERFLEALQALDHRQDVAEELQARVVAHEEDSLASTDYQMCEALRVLLTKIRNAYSCLAQENAHLRRQVGLTEELQGENAALKRKLEQVAEVLEEVENTLKGTRQEAERREELEKEREEIKSMLLRKSVEGECLRRAQTEESREQKRPLQMLQEKLTELKGRILKHEEQCQQFFQKLGELE
ncbi:golgin subfamily A member 6-like protein 25 [Phaenicophaeus curvirostris]|uniref:golgin subfamily A member 6-like protein 25 n=1 Tax=Phaenicophaeus curvirostris TaxID=33595 RepID=UPI0037F0E00E